MIEQRPADEVAVLVALHFEATAVDEQSCTLRDTGVDVAADLVQMLLRDERAHIRFRIRARSDFEATNLRLQRGDQPVRGRFRRPERRQKLPCNVRRRSQRPRP